MIPRRVFRRGEKLFDVCIEITRLEDEADEVARASKALTLPAPDCSLTQSRQGFSAPDELKE